MSQWLNLENPKLKFLEQHIIYEFIFPILNLDCFQYHIKGMIRMSEDNGWNLDTIAFVFFWWFRCVQVRAELSSLLLFSALALKSIAGEETTTITKSIFYPFYTYFIFMMNSRRWDIKYFNTVFQSVVICIFSMKS